MQKTASQVEAAEHFGVDPPKFTFSIEKKPRNMRTKWTIVPAKAIKKISKRIN